MTHEKDGLGDLKNYIQNIPNIDRACSTVIENSLAIFLPHKRLDKTNIYKEFINNNQLLELESDFFEKVEIRGRLLGQLHKDILEMLLTSEKTFNVEKQLFKVKITAYELLKKLGLSTGNKVWLIKKIKEIAECRIDLYFKDGLGKNISFNFGIIDDILEVDKEYLTINFTTAYTLFMLKTEMLEYSDYVNDIVRIENNFIKAIVRYLLIHKGNNSQIRIENLIKKLEYQKLISKIDLQRDLRLLKKEETQMMLRNKFGITLTNNNNTLTFNKKLDKKIYKIQTQKSLFE